MVYIFAAIYVCAILFVFIEEGEAVERQPQVAVDAAACINQLERG